MEKISHFQTNKVCLFVNKLGTSDLGGIIRLVKSFSDKSDKVMTCNIETISSENYTHVEIQSRNSCKNSSIIGLPKGFENFLLTVKYQHVCDFHSRLRHLFFRIIQYRVKCHKIVNIKLTQYSDNVL